MYAILILGAVNAGYNIISHWVIKVNCALERTTISCLGLAATYFTFIGWNPTLLIKSAPVFGYPSDDGNFNYTVLSAVIILILSVIANSLISRQFKPIEM